MNRFDLQLSKDVGHLLDEIRADGMLPDLALEVIETLECDFERVDKEIATLDRKPIIFLDID